MTYPNYTYGYLYGDEYFHPIEAEVMEELERQEDYLETIYYINRRYRV
jgi:hypothetical protein